MAEQHLVASNGWLSFNKSTPKLYITAEDDEFDVETLQQWRDEGFDVKYIPLGPGGKQYTNTLHSLNNGLGVGESYAIVAFGDAAAVCLETHIRLTTSKICALVAYYPTSIPDPKTRFSPSLRILVHLAGDEVGVNRNPEVLGIQGKRKTVRKHINPGIGTGGMLLKLAYPSYTYEGVAPGFAEHDLDEYDPVADRLAWTRSLDTVRRGFRAEVNIEKVWEEHVELEFSTKNAEKTMATMVDDPYVNHVPTMTGGIGKEELYRFYRDYFIPNNPPSLKMKLISRTIGVDKVVDEMFVTFQHTHDMPWMLPGIPPTNKHVEIALVSIVTLKGGKLAHEHIYWDQASVLFQLGLLDPNHIPPGMKNKGIEELPVVGNEGARKVLDEESEPSNELIPDWLAE